MCVVMQYSYCVWSYVNVLSCVVIVSGVGFVSSTVT